MIGNFPQDVILRIFCSACFTKSSAVNCRLGGATSSRWWGIPDISFLVTFPVPMLSPLYTCRESAEMISPFSFCAKKTPSELLPDAVGPTIAIILGLGTSLYKEKNLYFIHKMT